MIPLIGTVFGGIIEAITTFHRLPNRILTDAQRLRSLVTSLVS